MRGWGHFRRRVRYWLSRDERQRLLWEEMEYHVDALAADYVEQGMSMDDAQAAARRKFGNMTRQSEDARNIWLVRWWSDLAQDLRYWIRGMVREPGFAAFTILIAGLGIGASSTVFSVVNALLLRPLPFQDPSRLVSIANIDSWTATQTEHFADMREHNQSLADMAAWSGFYFPGDSQMTGQGEPDRVTSVPVTGNLFAVLGVAPALGRTFSDEESRGRYLAPTATILSDGFWRRQFAADRDVVGRKLMLNGRPVMVIGVLPPSFDFASIFTPGVPADIFIPWPLNDPAKPRGNTLKLVGRLKPGTTVDAAQAELAALAQKLASEHPERNALQPVVTPLAQRVSGRVAPALFVLACAVGVVMLIVCANLSNLQLARLGARQKELAMRTALGASRTRLLRQMLAENVALSCSGAVLGLVLAVAGTRQLSHLSAFNLPLLASIRVDGSALLFTLLAAAGSGLLFGLLPALRVSTLAPGEDLQDGSRGSSGGRRHAVIRDALVVAELAFACILLVGAGLLLRSFLQVLDVNLGFEPERAAALRVDPSFRFDSFAKQNAFFDDVLQRVRAVPGISAAGITDMLPLRDDRSWGVKGQGQVYEKGRNPESYVRVVTDGYFEAAGITLHAGRLFAGTDRATSEKVVVVNETFARTLWPGQDPLGQVITTDGGRRVVGVVADVRHTAMETASGLEMYLPMRQTADYASMQLVVRTALPADALASGLREALRQVDPNMPVGHFQTFEDLVNRAVSPRRFLILLLGGFAVFALLLASLGIYAVISYSVQQRVQEIGIRLALGASPGALQRGILLRTFGFAAGGLALGMAASRALSSLLSSLLFGITSDDPATYAGVAALLACVAAFAGYVPARRASRIDPMIALRPN